MRWTGQVDTVDGVRERGFEVEVDDRTVPGFLWLPEVGPGPRPLVLLGHGATRHKRIDYLVALGRRVAGDYGFAVAAIDGPGHGDRRAPGHDDEIALFTAFLAEWSREGTVDDMVADWRATLDALRGLDEVGDGPVGYWGLSMGTIYGVPLVAAEPRIQVAVFGLMGLVGPTRARLAADAAAISCPVLFLQQWDDSLIPRAETLELFDTLGSVDKRLHVHPGDHAAVPVEEIVFSARFLARHLAPHAGEDAGGR
ncbi:MAG: dienelactone hydrolase family protein [Acidimicrobiales bacterium]